MATAVGQAVDSRLRLPHAVVVEGLAAVGAGTAALVALHIGDSPMRAPDTLSSLRALGVALYVAVGSYTSWRRPGARFGFYLTGIGLFFAVATLAASHHQLPHSIGRVVFGGFSVCLAYVFLVFPHDRLGSRLERQVIAALAISSAALWLVTIPLVPELPAAGPLTDCSPGCPGNAFQLTPASAHQLTVLADVTSVCCAAPSEIRCFGLRCGTNRARPTSTSTDVPSSFRMTEARSGSPSSNETGATSRRSSTMRRSMKDPVSLRGSPRHRCSCSRTPGSLRTCRRRAGGLSARLSKSGCASSATSTTGRNSGCSPSRSSSRLRAR